jgi:hypothetical protein
MTLIDFLEQISDAEYFYFDTASMTAYEWNGAQTVNIWTVVIDPGGTPYFDNSDVFMGDYASVDEVKLDVDSRINGGDA